MIDEDDELEDDDDDDEDEENDVDCATCSDTGYVCDHCGNADGECTCEDGPELVDCPDCE